MFSNYRFNFVLSLTCLISLLILIGLGSWQVKRLWWKEGLITQAYERLSQPTLGEFPTLDADFDPAQFEYQPLILEGNFIYDSSILLIGRSYQGVTGNKLLTPFETSNGLMVMVDRGWMPRATTIAASEKPTMNQIQGVLKRGVPRTYGTFRPVNDPKRNIWVAIDTNEMSDALNMDLQPLYVVATQNTGSRHPIPGKPKPNFPNNHFNYALTWFGLALGLIFIYFRLSCMPTKPEQEQD